ncbi:MAG: head GIN domain-containing protein [Flavobacteriaceae bacterium]
MKNRTTLVLALLCMAAISAQRIKKIEGNGNVVTLTINTQEYSGISVGGPFDVALVSGKEGNITIKGEENILEYIETEVTNGTLTIKKRNNLNIRMSRNARVLITIPVESINAIRLSGSGKLSSTKTLKSDHFKILASGSRYLELALEVESLSVRTSGSSNIKLMGNAKNLDVRSSGSSNFKTYELEVDNASFVMSGSSNCEITVNESLDAKLSGSSNVKYRGNPSKLHSKASGSARVVEMK